MKYKPSWLQIFAFVLLGIAAFMIGFAWPLIWQQFHSEPVANDKLDFEFKVGDACEREEREIVAYMAMVLPENEAPDHYPNEPFNRPYCSIIVDGPKDIPNQQQIETVCSLMEQGSLDAYEFKGTATEDDIEPLWRVSCWDDDSSEYKIHYEWFGEVWPFGVLLKDLPHDQIPLENYGEQNV